MVSDNGDELMARTHQEWLEALPSERRNRIDGEAARLLAELDAREAERRIILETAQTVHHAIGSGLYSAITITPAWSGVPVVIRRTRDVLKLRRRHAA
jgi:hypothetical protein